MAKMWAAFNWWALVTTSAVGDSLELFNRSVTISFQRTAFGGKRRSAP